MPITRCQLAHLLIYESFAGCALNVYQACWLIIILPRQLSLNLHATHVVFGTTHCSVPAEAADPSPHWSHFSVHALPGDTASRGEVISPLNTWGKRLAFSDTCNPTTRLAHEGSKETTPTLSSKSEAVARPFSAVSPSGESRHSLESCGIEGMVGKTAWRPKSKQVPFHREAKSPRQSFVLRPVLK